jgi:hypothetical protein
MTPTETIDPRMYEAPEDPDVPFPDELVLLPAGI